MLTRKDPADPAETLPGGPWNAHENAEKALDAIAAESQGQFSLNLYSQS